MWASICRFTLPYELTLYQFIDGFNLLYNVVGESVAVASGKSTKSLFRV
jgi:hypothetical protein